MKVESHNLSNEANDGSRDDMTGKTTDEERFTSRDKRSNTETTFFTSDVDKLAVSPQRKHQYKRMHRWQDGEDEYEIYSPERESREQQNRGEWKRRVSETYSSQVELTPYQKERVQYLVTDEIDGKQYGPYSVEEVTIGVINHVAREDGRSIELEELFISLAEDVGLSVDDLRPLRKYIHGLV